jgi:putative oxidoreductase
MNETLTRDIGPLLLRALIGSLFIAHIYWKLAVLPGGLPAWWGGLVKAGYPPFVPAYVFSAEIAGALLLIPGVLTRYVALYAIPMMIGAAQFWWVRKGFYFTKAGAELPLVWLGLLCLQAFLGDGAFALVRSPRWRPLALRPERVAKPVVRLPRPKPTLEWPLRARSGRWRASRKRTFAPAVLRPLADAPFQARGVSCQPHLDWREIGETACEGLPG